MNYIRHLNAFFSYVKTDTRLTSSHVSLYMALFQYWNENRFKNPVMVSRDRLMKLSKIRSKNNYYKCLKELHQAGYIFAHLKESQFLKVKISMVKLGQAEEKNAQQLTVFSEEKTTPFTHQNEEGNTSQNEEEFNPENNTLPVLKTGQYCLKNGTAPVLKTGQYCLNYKTATVLKIRHTYKQNIIKTENSVCKTPTKIFEKNMKILNAINSFAAPPKLTSFQENNRAFPNINFSDLITVKKQPPENDRSTNPSKNQVETFFLENNYPVIEAQKFFYYNHGKGWKLTDKLPITDWQSLAHKWMLNDQIFKHNPNTANENRQKHPNLDVRTEKDYSEPL